MDILRNGDRVTIPGELVIDDEEPMVSSLVIVMSDAGDVFNVPRHLIHPAPPDVTPWLGKPLRELPDGSVACWRGNNGLIGPYIVNDGDVCQWDEGNKSGFRFSSFVPFQPAAHIIRLGWGPDGPPCRTLRDVKAKGWAEDVAGNKVSRDPGGRVLCVYSNGEWDAVDTNSADIEIVRECESPFNQEQH